MLGPSPLRVCLVCGFRPTPGGGGTEKHIYELACGLIERGVELDIVCEDRSYLPDDRNRLANRILGVDPESLQATEWVERCQEKSRRFAEMLDPRRYDIVHCHSHYGYRVALRLARQSLGPLLVSTFHLTPVGSLERFRQLGLPEPENAMTERAVGLMEETQAQLSDCCIAVSKGVAREVCELYGVSHDRVRTIYNWYDPRIFVACNYLRARQELGLAPEGRYLLYVGHFHHFRGYLLADAMRLLPHDIKLIVVHPDQDPALQAELGDRFVFAGYVPPERMRLYYSAADFQCFPTPYGAFGLVLVEGMACGCPPIVFDYPAMNEVVTPQTGYLVPEPTAPAYAACIERAFQDGPTKRRAAMERARCFEMDPQIDRVLALYRELIAGEKSPLSASGTLQVVDVNARGQTTRIAGAVPPSRPK